MIADFAEIKMTTMIQVFGFADDSSKDGIASKKNFFWIVISFFYQSKFANSDHNDTLIIFANSDFQNVSNYMTLLQHE